MSSLNDKTLEFAERIVNDAIEEKIKAAGVEQKDLPKFATWDGETCFDCGGEIPAGRLKLGRVRCVHCQEVAERHGRD